MNIRKTLILLAVTLFALEGSAQSTLGTFAERQTKQLERRKEQVAKQLSAAQKALAEAPSDSLRMEIHELNRQSEAIDNALMRIVNQEQERLRLEEEKRAAEERAKAEQEALALAQQEEAQKRAEQQQILADASKAGTTTEGDSIIVKSPMDRFSEALSANAISEGEIGILIESYRNMYKKASGAILAYNAATSLAKAQEHHNIYLEAKSNMDTLAQEIRTRSHELFESKLETYISIAEEVGANHMREKYANCIKSIDSKHINQIKGKCSDIDVAMYPYRLHSTIELEIEVAELLGCDSDSTAPLRKALDEYDPTYTLFAKLQTPSYADTEYKALKFNKSKAYASINDIPVIEIPTNGEVYSIQVAGYTTLPKSMSVFRNATPLFRETRSDSRTYFYVGLYPTAKSANDDIKRLSNAGFKKPTVVAWSNGVRRSDFVAKGSNANTVLYYRIEINGVDAALSDEAREAIRTIAPTKEISKFNAPDGSLIYSVGNFKKESEARNLATAITDADVTLSVTIVEFERKK